MIILILLLHKIYIYMQFLNLSSYYEIIYNYIFSLKKRDIYNFKHIDYFIFTPITTNGTWYNKCGCIYYILGAA